MVTATEAARVIISHRHRGRHRHASVVLSLKSLRAIFTESLVRNSSFLIANLVLSAACGYGALGLLTRLYPVSAVGLAAAAISAGGVIAFITQFGASYSLPRFLPVTAHRTALINTVLTVTMGATLLAAGIFLVLPISDRLYAIGGGSFVAIFLLTTTLDAGESQLENVFVADRSANKITSANVITNIIKIAAPGAFVFLGVLGAYLARVIGYIAGFVVLAVVLAKRGHKFRLTFSIEAIRNILRFSMGAYIGGIIGGLPLMAMPIIILGRFGAIQNAYWYTALAVASLLYQLPGSVAQALLAEAAHRPSERRRLMFRASGLVAAVMVPALIVTYVAAPVGLALLGRTYEAESLAALRWLVIAGAASSVNYITGAILYVAKKTFLIAVVNGVNAVILIGLTVVWATDIDGVAIAWLAGEMANAYLLAICVFYAIRQVDGNWALLGEEAHLGPSAVDDYRQDYLT